MAKRNIQDTNQNVTHSFIKGLNKDSDPSYVQEGMWTHAINATNNTIEGDIGTLSNESSNYLCITAGTTMPATSVNKYIVGAIYLYSDKWIIFTAGHNALGQSAMSEIGLFEEERCIYRPIVQTKCLGFDKRYLISGSAREKEDCTWQVYWADGLNPDRYLNIGDPKTWPTPDYSWVGGGTSSMNYYSNGTDTTFLWPGVAWNENCNIINNCEFCTKTNTIECNNIRLARLMSTPCLNLRLGAQGGTMANGTYFAVIAYTIKGQRVTDYFSPSNNQFVFTPNDLESSLVLEVSADSENFDEFVLVLVQNINQGTVAKQIGFYSTRTSTIAIDQVNPSLPTIPIEQIPIQTPVFEKSDQMTDVNSYLLRVGPTSKFDFNYQPLANLIQAKWASVEYPADYYVQGGNHTNYLRDEVYAFFIRWVYDTGDKSASYHIPGRPPSTFQIPGTTTVVAETAPATVANNLATDDRIFEVYNTAYSTASPYTGTTLPDGGFVLEVGDMGYWESEEIYPDNRPDIWNSSTYCWTTPNGQNTQYDLCGQPIRHHKFPENFLNNSASTNTVHFRDNPNPATIGNDYFIRIMGVFFENIILPKDQDGNDIPGIVGYEILRGSREGNKTIVAKGMVNNFRTYDIKGSAQKGRTGLYANYPFNTIEPIGPNSGDMVGQDDPYFHKINQVIPRDIISFHSPDTMFRTPFLNTTELKLYGNLSGYTTQQFIEPNRHPKFKLLADAAWIPMYLIGISEAIVSMIGKRTYNSLNPEYFLSQYDSLLSGGPGVTSTNPTQLAAQTAVTGYVAGFNTTIDTYYSTGLGYIGDAITALVLGYGSTAPAIAEDALIANINTLAATSPGSGVKPINKYVGTIEFPAYAYLPTPLRLLGGVNQIIFYFSEGASATLDLIYALLPYRQFALQQIAHGFYSGMNRNSPTDLYRFKIEESFYMRDNIQEISRYIDQSGLQRSYSINNLKRPDSVVIRTKSGPYFNPVFPNGVNIGPSLLSGDKSLVTLGTVVQANNFGQGGFFAPGTRPDFGDFDIPFSLPIQSHYAAIKGRVRNQYGQLNNIKQIIITPCEQKFDPLTVPQFGPYSLPGCTGMFTYKRINRTPILFNGDTYINRYTEKNTMCFYYDWLYGEPDGFEYNYFIRNMIPNLRFNANSIRYDVSDLSNLLNISINPISFIPSTTPGTGALPSRFYRLDYYVNSNRKFNYSTDQPTGFPDTYPGVFGAKEAKFYIANSSIRDFFVESDVLIDFRKQGDYDWEKHYDPYRYTNYQSMFNADPQILGRGNVYIYDYSLSVSKLYNQYFSSGNLQTKYYDPAVAKLCYTYYPDRIIYSLPQQDESMKDSWFVFLTNNYKEFKSQISGVKAINKSGIFITFKNDSPLMYQGVDTLQTELGTKITIGDGGLFSQPQQSITNADRPYEYGSSQNRLSVISSPIGIFYISQNQGKILAYNQGLQEISQNGMRWWFTLFLPYRLTVDFPQYPWVDNPVAGIGCQSVYDNTNGILYFSKKDYKLKTSMKDKVVYVPLRPSGTGDYFTLKDNPGVSFILGDTAPNALWKTYFDDASWTISYDPKNQFWISFHDWHPDLFIPTKDTFLTTKNNGAWVHNTLCSDFCNFYGEQKPFEVEIPFVTGQSVTTLRSFEYILECYRRDAISCVDQHHVLDFNFDQAVVYNSEQVSGYLNLNIFPKNNVTLSLEYPKLNPNLSSFDILFSKEENKYRFNQFWDITKDRDEFPIGSNYPPTGPLIPGTTVLQGNYASENTWITAPDGYTRILNPNNMDYTKPLLQRKKIRHYMNFLTLRRTNSGDVNMNLKLTNSKNQISMR
jgi:hypothetical protein